MSRNKYNNFISQNNKILFEARLQKKNNSILKINKLSINNKVSRNNNNNISFINTTRPFINDIMCKKRKNQSTLENSSKNNYQKSLSINKYIKKRNKQNNINGNNSDHRTNILTFFNLKKPTVYVDKPNKTFINGNKKITYYNNINNQNVNIKNSRNKEEKDKRALNLKKSKNYKNFNRKEINSMIKSTDIINDDNKFNSIKNDNNIYSKILIKAKLDYKKNKNKKRNEKIDKNDNKYSSFGGDDTIKKVKIETSIHLKNNNKPLLTINSSQRGRNTAKNRNKIDNDDFYRYTHTNFYSKNTIGKSYKSSYGEIKYKKKDKTLKKQKQKNKINFENLKNKKSINKKSKYNKITINKIDNKINSRNNKNEINKKHTYNNKLTQEKNNKDERLTTLDNIMKSINNKMYQEFDPIKKNKNNQENKNKNIKNLKKLEIVEDNNGSSTKTNEELCSAKSHNQKKNETSLEDNSGILSWNEIEDIIRYEDMADVSKNKNYLFHSCDYTNFIKQYRSDIYNKFFNNPNANYKISTIKIRKKNIMKNSENKEQSKEKKIRTYNNSIRKKK